MSLNRLTVALLLAGITSRGSAQNLPSLLLNRNINATFSILAYDSAAREWGIAVATNNIYVGNSTIYIRPGLGAFSVIAETEPAYAINGFKALQKGRTIRQAIEDTRVADSEWFNRQVSGIDSRGNVYAFTGTALQYWQGYSSHIMGKGFVVMGNQLADSVLVQMKNIFLHTPGTLAERLLKSLVAGQQAGGQLSGKQSAALVVKGEHNEWYNQVDLRVDNSKTPFEDLQRLLDYHYGRIRLNQAMYAIRAKDTSRGATLLHEAVRMLEGWNGIYPKIALAYILLGDEQTAVSLVRKGLAENPQWKEYLPAFYCLHDHPEIASLLHVETFSLKDWCNAVNFMLEINKSQDAIALAEKMLRQYPDASFLYYLLAQGYLQEGNNVLAAKQLRHALKLDPGNAEAKALLRDMPH